MDELVAPAAAPEPIAPPATARPQLVTLLRADVRRGVGAALIGCAAVALVEFVVSILAAQGSVRFATMLRFAALDVTLCAIAAALLAPLAGGLVAGARGLYALVDREAALAWRGLGARPARVDGPDRAVPWVWATLLGAGLYIACSYGLTVHFVKRYKEPHLVALVLAALQIGLVAGVALVVFAVGLAVRQAARALHRALGRFSSLSPLGHPGAGLTLLVAVVVPALIVTTRRLPTLRGLVPWRELAALGVLFVATVVGSRFVAGRPGQSLFPSDPRRRRRAFLVAAGAFVLLAPPTLSTWGANPEAKYLAISASPPLGRLVGFVRWANDFDRDGYGSLLGENDCKPFNKRIHPGARDFPDNGIDENCNGRDFSSQGRASWKTGEKMDVPPEFQRGDWNILLLTIDTVRYDHTSFGGYKEPRNGKAGRDTTPHLAALAARGVSFDFCNAPSAGTMASIPAIIMSKFFHSGIALGPERRPKPPKLLPENTTLGEMLKRAGYKTGAIVSHEYFNDWGIEQGFDTYDNEIGAKSNPNGVSSEISTDKAESWIAKQGQKKWFLWVHYIDPHGRYVGHPGHTQYADNATEEDIYDGELAYTDEYIGKLLDSLQRSPAGARTIVIVTSDHGDGFMEHGFINHGQKLYRELLHVPLIVYVPDVDPHTVPGPVSNLDIFPTVADLAGVDISDLGVEGESLVPQLFYPRDATERVVFSETNYPDPLRAAVTDQYKIIFNLKANVYELFDLHADPWEKKNLWGKGNKDAERQMKDLLDEWLDRVYYSRDAASQAQQVRSAYLLPKAPAPQHPADATAAGAVQILGWDVAKPTYKLGEAVAVTVYFKSVALTEQNYILEVEAIGQPTAGTPTPTPVPAPTRGAPPGPAAPTPAPARLAVRQEKVPGDRTFPTSKWRTGEYVKETFALRLPANWAVSGVQLGVRLLDDKRNPAVMTGPQAGDGKQALLGNLPIDVTPVIAPVPTTPVPKPTTPAPITPIPVAPRKPL